MEIDPKIRAWQAGWGSHKKGESFVACTLSFDYLWWARCVKKLLENPRGNAHLFNSAFSWGTWRHYGLQPEFGDLADYQNGRDLDTPQFQRFAQNIGALAEEVILKHTTRKPLESYA